MCLPPRRCWLSAVPILFSGRLHGFPDGWAVLLLPSPSTLARTRIILRGEEEETRTSKSFQVRFVLYLAGSRLLQSFKCPWMWATEGEEDPGLSCPCSSDELRTPPLLGKTLLTTY
jgi:hypothetical protein